jgi:transposase
MNREAICHQLTAQIKRLIDNENRVSDLLPDIRLLYGTQPGTRTPVMYQPGIVFLFRAIKLAISTSACSATTPMNICC